MPALRRWCSSGRQAWAAMSMAMASVTCRPWAPWNLLVVQEQGPRARSLAWSEKGQAEKGVRCRVCSHSSAEMSGTGARVAQAVAQTVQKAGIRATWGRCERVPAPGGGKRSTFRAAGGRRSRVAQHHAAQVRRQVRDRLAVGVAVDQGVARRLQPGQRGGAIHVGIGGARLFARASLWLRDGARLGAAHGQRQARKRLLPGRCCAPDAKRW